MQQGLRGLRRSLEHVKIRYSLISLEGIWPEHKQFRPGTLGWLGSFRDHIALISLETSLHLLFGVGRAPGPTQLIFEVLPPNIKALVITDDFYMIKGFRGQFEDDQAVQMFEDFLKKIMHGRRRSWSGSRMI